MQALLTNKDLAQAMGLTVRSVKRIAKRYKIKPTIPAYATNRWSENAANRLLKRWKDDAEKRLRKFKQSRRSKTTPKNETLPAQSPVQS